MTSKEILKLIKACRSSNVESLDFENLHVKFHSGDAGYFMVHPDKMQPTPTEKQLNIAEAEVQATRIGNDIEDVLATLAIEDPVAFEDGVVQQEFVFNEAEETADD